MVEAVACPRCRRPIPGDAPLGTCPACLLRLGLADTPAGTTRASDTNPAAAPTVSHVDSNLHPDDTRTGPGVAVSPEDGILPWLADYEVLEEIGRGGGGIVFRARQWAADRIVAVKFMLRGVGSPVERQRFRTEVRALGRFNHPNVVAVHDVGEADGCPYFAMEFLPGGSLARRAKERPYSPTDAAALVETLAGAVQSGHDAGVLHRDLKPGNVLLTTDGIPKIADFGLAKRWDDTPDADTVDRMTQTREVIGTPAYMAPEQAAAMHGSVGPATDVYGLGTILYELLTGGPPFKGDESQNTRWHVMHTPVVPPRDRNRQVPRALEAVALKCLEKDPAKRYPTAKVLADDLGRFRRGEETAARPLSTVGRAARTARRHGRVLLAVAAGVVLVSAAVAMGALFGNRDPVPAPDPAAVARQQEQDLRDGKPVTLIDESGGPKWHRWSMGEATVTDSDFVDGTFCLQTAAGARMVLMDDVPDTGYKLRCEMRHESTLDTQDSSEIGVFFGLTSTPSPNGGDVEKWYTLRYNDFAPEPNPLRPANNHVTVRAWAKLIRPGWAGNPEYNPLGTRLFVPWNTRGIQGWRFAEIEVRPSGFTVRWGPTATTLALIGEKPPDVARLDNVGRSLFQRVKVNAGDAEGATWPGWSPRGAVGLILGRGKASFRNVVIEP